ncbi:DUF6157 family protein [Nocardiopsis metallicus]|uniref:Uncharacterized protein n=1 Tax=Nocardiopsis metallicus TaxID=179819 RepID=A0A840VYI4_9ACTN|nr:DUF6157 family protein [Nocardiopsis metallicus]MBB5488872.1 hypothetical protein [Nocardiopsis metallicus]
MGKRHTICYFDTFITVSPDSAAPGAIEPPETTKPTVAAMTFEMISEAPYAYTSDDVLFTVWADRKEIPVAEREQAREEFFAKPRACFRTSDLGKRYGWGIHSDEKGRVALYAMGSAEYKAFASGTSPFTGEPVNVKAALRATRR